MNEADKKLMKIFEQVSPNMIKAEDMTPEMNIFTDIGLTSFDLLQVFYLIELEFHVKIIAPEVKGIKTIAGIAEIVAKKQNASK